MAFDFHGASLAQLNETIKDLESLDHWLNENKPLLNLVQAVFMNVLPLQKHQKILGELHLKTRDTDIQKVKETKYLSLQINGHLTWKSTWIQSRGRSPVP